MKTTLVGERNPYGSDDYYALYPAPDGCSGERLCRIILGMYRTDYLDSFERVNLVHGNWGKTKAQKRAAELLAKGGRFILFGAKVCSAFGVPFQPFTVIDEVLLRLPHPSGLNRMWSANPDAIQKTRELVAKFDPGVAHLLGTIDAGDVEWNTPEDSQ